jgi:chromosome segregation ATPase
MDRNSENFGEELPDLASQVAGKIDRLVQTSKQKDALLEREREKTRALAGEYALLQGQTQDRILKLEAQLKDVETNYRRLHTYATEQKEKNLRLTHQAQVLEAERQKLTSELTQYQTAWKEIQAREAHYQRALAEQSQFKKQYEESLQVQAGYRRDLAALEHQLKQSKTLQETYQNELRQSLIRVHASEARFSEIQKEITTLQQVKRNAEEEVARIESTMRERFQWELIAEKEKIRTELERRASEEREKYRQETLGQLQKQFDERLKLQNQELRDELEFEVLQVQENLTEKIELLKSEKTKIEELLTQLHQEHQSLKAFVSREKRSNFDSLLEMRLLVESLQSAIEPETDPEAISKELELILNRIDLYAKLPTVESTTDDSPRGVTPTLQ